MEGGLPLLCVGVGCVTYVGVRATFAQMPTKDEPIELEERLSKYLALATNLPLVREVQAYAQKAERRSQALKELPTLLDVVTLGLSAGLSFDASLELYCDRYGTSLSGAFREAMLLWQMGVSSRSDALRRLAGELDVMALRRFASAVTQALAFGSPLAESLEQQAQAIREEQRAEIEAEIERVPVKMLVPLGMLIVPAMLLSILGPLLGSSIGFG